MYFRYCSGKSGTVDRTDIRVISIFLNDLECSLSNVCLYIYIYIYIYIFFFLSWLISLMYYNDNYYTINKYSNTISTINKYSNTISTITKYSNKISKNDNNMKNNRDLVEG